MKGGCCERDRNHARQERSRRDAQGRRDHGRHQRRAGADRRGRGRLRRHGARARPGRHPPRRRRRPDGRSGQDPRDPGGGDHPGHGQGPHRPLRRGAGAPGARGRLHRRVRGADAGRRGQPHQQVGVHHPVRVRRDQPGRGAAAHQRGRGDDPLQGRGRHRQRRRGRAPHALDPGRDQPPRARWTRTSCTRRPSSTSAPYELVATRRARPPAGRHVHRGRHRDAGRRRADDAARRRRRVRRLRHLQELRPGRDAPPRSSRRRPTSTTRSSLAEVSSGLGEPMVGIEIDELGESGLLQTRGW